MREIKNRPIKKKIPKIELRDAINKDHYDFFMINAGADLERLKHVRAAQLRIIYTLLYHLGLRVNELRFLTKNDLLLAIQTGEINIVHSKTNTVQMHVLPMNGKAKLNQLKNDIEFLFNQHGFHYLGNSKQFSDIIFNEENFARFVNDDMEQTCKKYEFLKKYKSHSFRVRYMLQTLYV
jgi:integrase